MVDDNEFYDDDELESDFIDTDDNEDSDGEPEGRGNPAVALRNERIKRRELQKLLQTQQEELGQMKAFLTSIRQNQGQPQPQPQARPSTVDNEAYNAKLANWMADDPAGFTQALTEQITRTTEANMLKRFGPALVRVQAPQLQDESLNDLYNRPAVQKLIDSYTQSEVENGRSLREIQEALPDVLGALKAIVDEATGGQGTPRMNQGYNQNPNQNQNTGRSVANRMGSIAQAGNKAGGASKGGEADFMAEFNRHNKAVTSRTKNPDDLLNWLKSAKASALYERSQAK